MCLDNDPIREGISDLEVFSWVLKIRDGKKAKCPKCGSFCSVATDAEIGLGAGCLKCGLTLCIQYTIESKILNGKFLKENSREAYGGHAGTD